MADATGACPPAAPERRRALRTTDILAGLATSTLYTTATYPVHRVKVLMQTQDANPHILSGRVQRYTFRQVFARLLREQGPAGLFRGNAPYLLRHVPSVAMSFALKDALRERLHAGDAASPAMALAINAAAGGAAGAISLALVYPLEFATVRMAADVGADGGRQFGSTTRAALLLAARKEGVMSTYRGFGVTVVSTAAYKSLYFGFYDSAKPYVLGANAAHPSYSATSPAGFAVRASLAAATTLAAASIAYPLDVVRKRLIVDTAADMPQYHSSVVRCVREIWRREGVTGFYRAWGFDMGFRVFAGLVLVGYDAFGELLQRER